MNKAFVREPEPMHDLCPRCGAAGTPVGTATLDALVRPDHRARLGDSAAFCPSPLCEVAYFDAFDRTVPVEGLARPVHPKDPTAPLCPCFGFGVDDIEADLDEGGVSRTRALVERARREATGCTERAADGRCCIEAVQRYYFQRRAARAR
jgi:hypothetical protein